MYRISIARFLSREWQIYYERYSHEKSMHWYVHKINIIFYLILVVEHKYVYLNIFFIQSKLSSLSLVFLPQGRTEEACYWSLINEYCKTEKKCMFSSLDKNMHSLHFRTLVDCFSLKLQNSHIPIINYTFLVHQYIFVGNCTHE